MTCFVQTSKHPLFFQGEKIDSIFFFFFPYDPVFPVSTAILSRKIESLDATMNLQTSQKKEKKKEKKTKMDVLKKTLFPFPPKKREGGCVFCCLRSFPPPTVLPCLCVQARLTPIQISLHWFRRKISYFLGGRWFI